MQSQTPKFTVTIESDLFNKAEEMVRVEIQKVQLFYSQEVLLEMVPEVQQACYLAILKTILIHSDEWYQQHRIRISHIFCSIYEQMDVQYAEIFLRSYISSFINLENKRNYISDFNLIECKFFLYIASFSSIVEDVLTDKNIKLLSLLADEFSRLTTLESMPETIVNHQYLFILTTHCLEQFDNLFQNNDHKCSPSLYDLFLNFLTFIFAKLSLPDPQQFINDIIKMLYFHRLFTCMRNLLLDRLLIKANPAHSSELLFFVSQAVIRNFSVSQSIDREDELRIISLIFSPAVLDHLSESEKETLKREYGYPINLEEQQPKEFEKSEDNLNFPIIHVKMSADMVAQCVASPDQILEIPDVLKQMNAIVSGKKIDINLLKNKKTLEMQSRLIDLKVAYETLKDKVALIDEVKLEGHSLALIFNKNSRFYKEIISNKFVKNNLQASKMTKKKFELRVTLDMIQALIKTEKFIDYLERFLSGKEKKIIKKSKNNTSISTSFTTTAAIIPAAISSTSETPDAKNENAIDHDSVHDQEALSALEDHFFKYVSQIKEGHRLNTTLTAYKNTCPIGKYFNSVIELNEKKSSLLDQTFFNPNEDKKFLYLSRFEKLYSKYLENKAALSTISSEHPEKRHHLLQLKNINPHHTLFHQSDL